MVGGKARIGIDGTFGDSPVCIRQGGIIHLVVSHQQRAGYQVEFIHLCRRRIPEGSRFASVDDGDRLNGQVRRSRRVVDIETGHGTQQVDIEFRDGSHDLRLTLPGHHQRRSDVFGVLQQFAETSPKSSFGGGTGGSRVGSVVSGSGGKCERRCAVFLIQVVGGVGHQEELQIR